MPIWSKKKKSGSLGTEPPAEPVRASSHLELPNPGPKLERQPSQPDKTVHPLSANEPSIEHQWTQWCRCSICKKKPKSMPKEWILVGWIKEHHYYHDPGATYPCYRQPFWYKKTTWHPQFGPPEELWKRVDAGHYSTRTL